MNVSFVNIFVSLRSTFVKILVFKVKICQHFGFINVKMCRKFGFLRSKFVKTLVLKVNIGQFSGQKSPSNE